MCSVNCKAFVGAEMLINIKKKATLFDFVGRNVDVKVVLGLGR